MKQQNLRLLRDAFGAFMTGVTVVTTLDEKGHAIGFTANSFSSVSLDPPLLLVCIAKTSKNYDSFVKSKSFAVNVLSEKQKGISNTFAGAAVDRFKSIDWRLSNANSPIISNVCAWFDCSLNQTIEAGDHTILIGKVEDFDVLQTNALGYYRGGYFTHNVMANAIDTNPNVIVAALFEAEEGILLMSDNNDGFRLPMAKVHKQGIYPTLEHLIQDVGVDAQSSFIYSVYDDSFSKYVIYRCSVVKTEDTKGQFMQLTTEIIQSMKDAAVQKILERYVYESSIGNYGVYFGDKYQGIVAQTKGVSL